MYAGTTADGFGHRDLRRAADDGDRLRLGVEPAQVVLRGLRHATGSRTRPLRRLSSSARCSSVRKSCRKAGWEQMLGHTPLAADIDRRLEVVLRVGLDRDRDCGDSSRVDERRERQDALVADPFLVVEADDAREVRLLAPERALECRLLQEVRDDLVLLDLRARRLDAEPAPDLDGLDAGVVAESSHGRRARWKAVLAQAGLALGRRPGEEDPGHARALPERRLRRKPILVERLHAELAQVAERRAEPGRRDHLVHVEDHRAGVRRALGVHAPAVGGLLDLARSRSRRRSCRRRSKWSSRTSR